MFPRVILTDSPHFSHEWKTKVEKIKQVTRTLTSSAKNAGVIEDDAHMAQRDLFFSLFIETSCSRH